MEKSIILERDDPRIDRIKYNKKIEKTADTIFIYNGQLKLLLMAMQFFNRVLESGPYTILYVGAAPGLSIPILDRFYRKWIKKWILYDPELFVGNFCKEIEENAENRFDIRRKYFDELEAQSIPSENLIVLFDHRTSDKSRDKMTEDFTNSTVWLRTLQPVAACIKFRLPWPNSDKDTIEGIAGTIMIQPCTAQFSAECRLWIFDVNDTRLYNLREHEEKMFYYNLEPRWQLISSEQINMPGFDMGQDSQMTLKILNDYVTKAGDLTLEEVLQECQDNLPRVFQNSPIGVLLEFAEEPEKRIKQPIMINAIKREKTKQFGKKHRDTKNKTRF